MDIKIGQFCSLATAPKWQTWLFGHDGKYYAEFIEKLRKSTGCRQNSEIMKEALDYLEKKGSRDALETFLKKEFPNALSDGKPAPAKPRPKNPDPMYFRDFMTKALTFPRRQIITGNPDTLVENVNKFLAGKIMADYVIFGNRAYIEYLEEQDAKLKDKVPFKNWKTSTWKHKYGPG